MLPIEPVGGVRHDRRMTSPAGNDVLDLTAPDLRERAEELLRELAGPDGSSGPAGEVVGCCYTRREPTDADGVDRAELGLFAVHPSVQSRGLGARLLEAQAEHQRTAGVDMLMIQVLQSRPELHAWYERHGFVPTGHSVPFAGEADWLKVEGLGMDVMERPLCAL